MHLLACARLRTNGDAIHNYEMADGKGYMAIAITEEGSGSDFTSMQAISHGVSGGYVLNGEKRFNARLKQASDVIVFTKSNTGAKDRINAPSYWKAAAHFFRH